MTYATRSDRRRRSRLDSPRLIAPQQFNVRGCVELADALDLPVLIVIVSMAVPVTDVSVPWLR
jgi:hypothetical protein